MEELTKTQKLILNFLQNSANGGLPPTVREICAATGIKSTSSVHTGLCALEQKGYIKRESGINRSVRLANSTCFSSVPLAVELEKDENGSYNVGKTVASIPFPNDYSHGQNGLFAVRVNNDFLEDEGILDGDIVIAYFCNNAEDGEFAVIVNNKAPQIIKQKETENETWQIVGKVIACIRFYG